MLHESYYRAIEGIDMRPVDYDGPLKVARALWVIEHALRVYRLATFYALFSGGHDSLTSTHVASQHPAFGGVIHIDTGTGLPETRQFVEDTCKAQGWRLRVYTVQDAIAAGFVAKTYETLIHEYGLPGAPQHSNMYRYLKQRPLEQAKRELAPGKKWALITGVRTQESDRRMGYVSAINAQGSYIWIAPISNWHALDCSAYMRANALPRNAVKDAMHISGECFCGAFANPEELRMLEIFYPAQAARIREWERLAREAGHTGTRAQWGGGRLIPTEQMELMPMCYFCRGDLDAADEQGAA
jgi:3'-phosphoadenosine 5'-phosphosulfate sulfotransferase (PAPS reductase)/FAD synthetase